MIILSKETIDKAFAKTEELAKAKNISPKDARPWLKAKDREYHELCNYEFVIEIGELHEGTNYELVFNAITGELKSISKLSWYPGEDIRGYPINPSTFEFEV